MKSTGIIRKIDDLGRIVLPKELRKTLNINSGDDFQIEINNEKIILEKYSRLESYEELIFKIISSFSHTTNCSFYFVINDKIINSNYKVTKIISNIIKTRKMFINERVEKNVICDNLIVEGKFVLLPVVINSDLLGAVIVIGDGYIKILETYAKIIFELIKKIIVNTN